MSREMLASLTVIAVLASGCDDNSKLLDPQGHFTLFVSNQSFAITPVDIRVEIDGETVVHENFEVGDQHTWKAFRLSLQPGEHTLRVLSRKGSAELSKEFELKAERGAVINYWDKSYHSPTPKHFSFEFAGVPLGIS